MLGKNRNKAATATPEAEIKENSFIVDRLPNSFVNDPRTFRVHLGEQIDRFWPASGLNFLFDDDGNVNGFFDGSFLYIFHLSDDLETYTVATCIKDCASQEERYRGIKEILLEREGDITLKDNFSLEWTEFKELILKNERVPVNLVQEDHVDAFEASIDDFINTAHKITDLIKKAEKKKKRESTKRFIFGRKLSKATKEKQKENENTKKNVKNGSIRSIRKLFAGDWSGRTELDDSDKRFLAASATDVRLLPAESQM